MDNLIFNNLNNEIQARTNSKACSPSPVIQCLHQSGQFAGSATWASHHRNPRTVSQALQQYSSKCVQDYLHEKQMERQVLGPFSRLNQPPRMGPWKVYHYFSFKNFLTLMKEIEDINRQKDIPYL